jgi:hypothetical protein
MIPSDRSVTDNLFPGLRLSDFETPGAPIRVPERGGDAHGVVGRCFGPLALWRGAEQDMRRHALPGSHHHLAGEIPDLAAAAFMTFGETP